MSRRMIGVVLLCCSTAFFSTGLRVQERKEIADQKTAAEPGPDGLNKRILVLTDIENEPDDTMSMVRLMLYSNQIDIEGLVATTSMFMTDRVAPESIHKVVQAYSEARPNLLLHEKGFPTFEELDAKVKHGLPVYGMKGVGEGHDSEGSEWIIKVLEKPDERPLWVTVWGGPNTLAQALWKIQRTKTPEEAEKLYRKLRVYTISDQDDSGSWIRKTFPHVFYVCSPGVDFGAATWIGINFPFPGSNTDVISPQWLARNIQQGHGSLGAAYPDIAYGMEGDTPSYLSLIPNGLNDPEHPNYGGWGGRYELYTMMTLPGTLPAKYRGPEYLGNNPAPPIPPSEKETRPIWTNAEDTIVSPLDNKAYKSIHATVWRWREDFQNDFAGRMCWATKNYKECNHPPVVLLKTPDKLTVHSGDRFYLDASASTDPDGDSLSFLWFQYPQAGTYAGTINFKPFSTNLRNLPVMAPIVDKPETLHFIVKVTDKGTPPLTRYRRVIVEVLPKQ